MRTSNGAASFFKNLRKMICFSRSLKKAWFGRCICKKNQIYVFQNWRYRWLTFESRTIQTLIHRKYPQRIALGYIQGFLLSLEYRLGDVCLLGLGGAGVAHALTTLPEPPRCLAIEHNPTVIEMAKHYFFIESLSFLTVKQNDAYAFLEQTSLSFDHVWVDLFNSNTFPQHCNRDAFVTLCCSKLNRGGVLAVNFANFNQQKPLFHALKASFQQQMILCIFPDSSNIVALCLYENNIQDLVSKLQKSNQIKSFSWEKDWGYVASF